MPSNIDGLFETTYIFQFLFNDKSFNSETDVLAQRKEAVARFRESNTHLRNFSENPTVVQLVTTSSSDLFNKTEVTQLQEAIDWAMKN